MKKGFSKKFFIFIFIFFLFLTTVQVFAQNPPNPTPRTNCPTQGLVPCGTQGCPCTFCDFFVLFKNIVDFLLAPPGHPNQPLGGIIWPIAILMLAIGGFMYIIAFVNPESGPGMLTRAKAVFTTTVFGLLIMFSAWIVINLFFQIIGVQEWTGLIKGWKEGWWVINCP